jgi:superfamily II DNA or RNA helicase
MSDITKKYIKYKIKKTKETIDDFCAPTKYKLQPQQQFVADYFSSKDSLPGMLVYHQIGAGKTCAAITVAEQMKKKYNIIVVLPASLIGNFMDELRTPCPGENEYLTVIERRQLITLKPEDKSYQNIIKKSEERISKYYTIYSYHKFVELTQKGKIKLNNTLLIIDEVQNMVSLTGTFYRTLKKLIDSYTESVKILILSATPMFDKPNEIGLTLNLLKPPKEFPVGCDFNQMFLSKKGNNYQMKNMKKFISLSQGLVSYFRGAPPFTYPEEIFKVVKCNMSDFQYKSYLTSLSAEGSYVKGSFRNVDILNLPQNFFLGPRMVSNIAFPNKSIGENGFSSLTKEALQLQNINNYSVKFYKILQKIKKSEGPVFVYSNFKDLGGIRSFIKFIESHGFKNYKVNGEGNNRFAVWTGDEKHKMKEEIKFIFNHKDNEKGSNIKIMIGSPSVREGVSFKRVRQVHILEPYWNMSRILQIIGRAIRFCSHKDLPKKDRLVDVYLYLACRQGETTIDQYIWALAKQKSKLIDSFETALKEVAVDCELFYNRNVYPEDEYKLQCKNE